MEQQEYMDLSEIESNRNSLDIFNIEFSEMNFEDMQFPEMKFDSVF